MNDNTQSLPINLLIPSNGTSGNTGSLLPGFSSAAPQDKTFSQELSRASNRRQSDSFGRSQTNPDGARQQERNVTQADNAPRRQHNPSSESTESSSSKTDQISHKNTRKTDNSDNDSNSVNDSTANQSAEKTDSDTDVDENGVSNAVAGQSDDDQSSETGTSDEESASSAVAGTVDTTAVTTSQAAVTAAAASERGSTVGNPNSIDAAETAEKTQAVTAGKALPSTSNANEHLLSPAQLANRQSHLGSHTRTVAPGMAAGSESKLVNGVAVQSAPPVTTAVASTVIASSLGGGQNRKLADANKVASSEKLEAGLVQTVSDRLVSDKQLQSAANDVVIEAENSLEMQKNQQQQMQANLAEKQLLKQMQSKVQAEIQAHVQSLQTSTQANSIASARTSADAASGLSDNMFHTMSSGIVTAPVPLRSDTSGTQPANAPLTLPLLQSDADKTMSSNIRWMVNEGVRNAVVNVTPSGMGPISVSVGIENDHMNVTIVALQGSTREALDSMLPRLREQLAAQGHDSVRVDISNGDTENSDRGFDRSGSGDSQGTEYRGELPVDLAGGEPDGLLSGSDVENADGLKQESITVDRHGQVSSRYDVYV